MGRSIKELHPRLRKAAYDLFKEAALLGAYPYNTGRTFEEQAVLYAQGRTAPGKIVTNAQPGQSYHNYGLAFDMVFKVNGEWSWSGDWDKLGALAKKYGFEWGGSWARFPDRPHLQKTFSQTTDKLLAVYNVRKDIKDVWAYINTVDPSDKNIPVVGDNDVPELYAAARANLQKLREQVMKNKEVKVSWLTIIGNLLKAFGSACIALLKRKTLKA
jgi:peptidoglycan L-alanyl-D-glutamate endopeptidase CwlK